jgi:hypothetical protein
LFGQLVGARRQHHDDFRLGLRLTDHRKGGIGLDLANGVGCLLGVGMVLVIAVYAGFLVQLTTMGRN